MATGHRIWGSCTIRFEADKFRIKIWDSSNNGAIVYDNAPGSDDINASGQMALGGGDIIIHK